MASIVCPGCGGVIDSHQKACPRCGRCPCCGAQVSAEDAVCRTCGHPENEEHLRAMECALDPAKPENVKLARWGQQLYENERVQERMRWGRVVVLMVLLTFPVALATFFVLYTLLGFSGSWPPMIVVLIQLTLFRVLVNLLRLGCFPWLLHPPAAKDGEKQGGADGP